MSRCAVGIDLGGTNVRAAVVREDGTLAGPRIHRPSLAMEGTDATIQAIAGVVLDAVAHSDEKPTAAGMAVPGRVDDALGMVVWSPNFGTKVDGRWRIWRDVLLRPELERLCGMEFHLGNDANLAALGEYKFGSGQNSAACLALFTMGTGIGFGCVMGPQSVQGDARGPLMLVGGNKGGGEFGHTVIAAGGMDCSSGEYGSIEAYCSKDAIVRRARRKLDRGRDSIIIDWCDGHFEKVSPRMLGQAAEEGDELAIEVWREIGTYLGIGIGNAINIFAPDVVAVGGQVAKAGRWLIEPAIASARETATPPLFQDAKIGLATLIEDAGILGGAALALESIAGR